jgi:threonine aldolase
MYYFTSDYTTGCTPEILEVLGATNLEETAGYGEDAYCEAARALIQKECGRPDADVYFMMAGTQTNLTIISASLRPFHGVYGTARSHINTHEANAARHRSVSRGFAYNGRVNIAHQFAVNSVNANVYNHRAFFNHIGRYKAGLAYCRNYNIRLTGNFGNVFGFAVADGNGGVFV